MNAIFVCVDYWTRHQITAHILNCSMLVIIDPGQDTCHVPHADTDTDTSLDTVSVIFIRDARCIWIVWELDMCIPSIST